MSARRAIGIAALVTAGVIGTRTAEADPGPAIDGDGGFLSAPTQETELTLDRYDVSGAADTPPPPIFQSIVIDLPRLSELPRPRNAFVSLTSMPTLPPGSTYTDYEGFQSYVVRRLQRKFQSKWYDQLYELYSETNITDAELSALNTRMGDAWLDMNGGDWWRRGWMDFLPAEKGGAPELPHIEYVGQDIEFLEIGPLKVSNTLKAKIDRVALLDFDGDPGRVYRDLSEIDGPQGLAREHADLRRAMSDRDRDDAPTQGPMPSFELDFLLPQPKRRLFENVSFRAKFRPSVRLHGTTELDAREWISEVQAELEIEVRYGARREKVIEIEVEVEYEPDDDELTAEFEIALLTW